MLSEDVILMKEMWSSKQIEGKEKIILSLNVDNDKYYILYIYLKQKELKKKNQQNNKQQCSV